MGVDVTIERAPVSVLIRAHNEELNLRDCLASVCGWVDEVFVVNSFSTDKTRQIADEFGIDVVQHRFERFAQQKNWPWRMRFSNDWVLILDADERATGLAAEISGKARSAPPVWDRHYCEIGRAHGREATAIPLPTAGPGCRC